tara:strand:+ start:316 stop:546 length:231 start_codon:yes stop_codon:yes gene_type:complete
MRSIIEISGQKYECEFICGERLVLVYFSDSEYADSEWMPQIRFVDHLADHGKYDQLVELANYGYAVFFDENKEDVR